MRTWAASLAIHGLILAPLIALTQQTVAPAEPLRWEVSLLAAPPPPAVEKPAPEPPRPPQVQARLEPPPPEPKPESKPVTEPLLEPTPPLRPTVPEPVAVEPPPAAPAAARPVAMAPPPPVAPPVKVAPTPVPPAALPPAAVPQRPEPDVMRRWQAALAAMLRERKRYPLAARKLGQEGVVVLEAVVHPDGRVEPGILRGSGHAILDRAALGLLREAIDAVKERPSLSESTRLEVPVAYRLEG